MFCHSTAADEGPVQGPETLVVRTPLLAQHFRRGPFGATQLILHRGECGRYTVGMLRKGLVGSTVSPPQ